jgi:hypothetical protein
VVTHLLDSLYWYSRTSLVGLDVWATVCAAAAIFLEPIASTMFDKDNSFSTGSALLRVSLGTLWLWVVTPALLMLRVISPVSVAWSSWTSVVIERSRLSHRERASKRIADQLAPLKKLAVSSSGLFTATTKPTILIFARSGNCSNLGWCLSHLSFRLGFLHRHTCSTESNEARNRRRRCAYP